MSDKTAIEWTDATWNPVHGCSKVSAGCTNCYAEKVSHRFGFTSKPWNATYASENVKLHPERLDQPLRWKQPRRIFVNSMSDLFHEQVPFDFIDQVFAVMALSPRHTFQILTKRPSRMLEYFDSYNGYTEKLGCITPYMEQYGWQSREDLMTIGAPAGSSYPNDTPWPLPNVWLGVSVENQQAADERIPFLLQTPAAVRFLSCEPLLGAVEISNFLVCEQYAGEWKEPRKGTVGGKPYQVARIRPRVDWVIAGGESGPNARPMHPDWARSLRDQCVDAGVPFFFKQFGEWAPGSNFVGHIHSGKSHDFGQNLDDNNSVWRVGKKAAGRSLDGRTWDEFPMMGGEESAQDV